MSTIVGAKMFDHPGKIEKLISPAPGDVEFLGAEILETFAFQSIKFFIMDHGEGLRELCRGSARRGKAVADDANLLGQTGRKDAGAF